VLPGASMVAVEQALLSARAHDRELTVAAIDEPTLELAHELEARHRWA
jgi:hypothetical protein